MVDNILIVESKQVQNFYPFSALHPIWELKVGTLKTFERYFKEFSNCKFNFCGRFKQMDKFLKRYKIENSKPKSGKTLIFNSNIIITDQLLFQIENLVKDNKESSFVIKSNNDLLAIFIAFSDFDSLNINLTDDYFIEDIYHSREFESFEIECSSTLGYIWDAIYLNSEILKNDIKYYPPNFNSKNHKYQGVYFENGNNIHIGENVIIQPNCFLDATAGPIMIDNNVKIMASSTIIGPCYIGTGSTIKIGSKIYSDCTIGNDCKIGGELEGSIIQGYTNKQHDGFLGHSFISEWVNLGAGTNNSDLKNTYSSIKLRIYREEYETGKMFVGLICGDHSKSSINTQFNTGTVVGVASIIVADGFPPNFIPSFSWGGKKDSPLYKPSKALEIAGIVMKRRGVDITTEDEQLILDEYNSTVILK